MSPAESTGDARHADRRRLAAPWGYRGAAYAVSVLPIIHLFALVVLFSHDVPMSDDWDLVPLLQKHAAHDLSWHDLWQPYAEHRILFGRLAMIALASLTHWSLPAQCAINVLVAVAGTAPFLVLLRAYLRQAAAPDAIVLLPACSVLIFSSNGWINYLWGWQFSLLLSVAAVISGVALLWTITSTRLAFAAALGVVASCSFANGIFFWPLAVGIILFGDAPRQQRLIAAGGFALLGALVTYVVVNGLPVGGGTFRRALDEPLSWSRYVLNFLGTPMAPPTHFLAVATGAGGVLLFSALVILLYRHRTPALVPIIALGLYSILNAFSIGAGRAQLGYTQGSDPRYYPFAVLLWVSILILLDHAARSYNCRAPVIAFRVAAVGLVLASCVRSAPQWRNIGAYESVQLNARAALLSGTNDAALAPITTARVPLSEIRARDQVLRDLRLSLHHVE